MQALSEEAEHPGHRAQLMWASFDGALDHKAGAVLQGQKMKQNIFDILHKKVDPMQGECRKNVDPKADQRRKNARIMQK